MTKTIYGALSGWLLMLIVCCLPCFMPGSAAAGMISSSLAQPSVPLLPDLEYYIDVTGSMDVEEIATPANAAAFRPLDVSKLPNLVGVTWMRFTLAPLREGVSAQPILLDLGQSVPAGSVLYEAQVNPSTDGLEWREKMPTERSLFQLPKPGTESRTCYIRMDGLPGLWFAPMLRSPENAVGDWTRFSGKAACLALCVVMALCLLRCLSERGQWRIWTALYVFMALVHGAMGIPAYGLGGITSGQAAAVLSPGLALMVLPHVGRHLMGTKEHSRLLDAQFVILGLLGAVLALLPLLPGLGWTIRYLPVWPVCTLAFSFSALWAALMGLAGARRYLLACLVPPLCVALGILGMNSPEYDPELLASAPLWGIALSAMLIAGTGLPVNQERKTADQSKTQAHNPLHTVNSIVLDQPLDDPNLRLLPPMQSHNERDTGASFGVEESGQRLPPEEKTLLEKDVRAWTDGLRQPLDQLLRDGTALTNCSLAPVARQYAENMLHAAQDLAHRMDQPGISPNQNLTQEEAAPFNLQHLVRAAHDSVSTAAEQAGIGLSWYMPPLLGHWYQGQARLLRETLDILLESALRATEHGAVKLSVRRMPGSRDPGYLLFNVTDTGAGSPPLERSTQVVNRVWELAAAHGGYVNVESGPQGASVSFGLHLVSLEEGHNADEAQDQHEQRPIPTVAVVAADDATRQNLARMVTNLGCKAAQARNMQEALLGNREAPALMLVAQPAHSTPAEAEALGRFVAEGVLAGLPVFKALAITKDNSQWEALADTGYTHAMLEPLDSEAFATTLHDVLHAAGFAVPDVPAAETIQQAQSSQDAPTGVPDLFGSEQPASAGSPMQPQEGSASSSDIFGSTRPSQEAPLELAVREGTSMPEIQTEEQDARAGQNKTKDSAAGERGQAGKERLTLARPAMDEWVGEPMPVPKAESLKAKNSEKTTASPTSMMDASPATDSVASARSALDEWVGEPMPISKPAGRNTVDGQNAALRPLAEESSPPTADRVASARSALEEWVGEPMPVPKAADSGVENAAAQELLTEFDRDILKLLELAGEAPHEDLDHDDLNQGDSERLELGQGDLGKDVQDFAAMEQMLGPERNQGTSSAPQPTAPLVDFIAGARMPAAASTESTVRPSKPTGESAQPPATPAETTGQQARMPQARQTERTENVRGGEPWARMDMEDVLEPAKTIPRLIARLDAAMQDARQGLEQGQCLAVGDAAERIARESDAFGFRVLGRMARCVERAAKAEDIQAVRDLLPELDVAVERNRIALSPRPSRKLP